MKITKIFAMLFALMGLALAVCSVWLGFTSRNAEPVLVSPSKDAYKTAQAVLEEACSGNYSAVSQKILGNPQFGMRLTTEDPAEEMIWKTFQNSFSYTLIGDCFITESGLAQKASISYLDLDSVTEGLKERIQELLEEKTDNAEHPEELYDEHHEIKEIYVMEALQTAVAESVAGNVRYKTVEFTIHLIWRDAQWWVLPDDALLSALTGGLAK